jgi:hypothetical protein
MLSLDFAALLCPVVPATGVLSDLLPSCFASQPGSCSAAYSGLAIDDHLGILARAGPAVALLELLVGYVEAVGCRCNRDVDSPWDAPSLLQLTWFSYICKSILEYLFPLDWLLPESLTDDDDVRLSIAS